MPPRESELRCFTFVAFSAVGLAILNSRRIQKAIGRETSFRVKKIQKLPLLRAPRRCSGATMSRSVKRASTNHHTIFRFKLKPASVAPVRWVVDQWTIGAIAAASYWSGGGWSVLCVQNTEFTNVDGLAEIAYRVGRHVAVSFRRAKLLLHTYALLDVKMYSIINVIRFCLM